MDSNVSNAITLVRFPLAFLVILKHYYTNDIVVRDDYPVYSALGDFSTGYFPAFVVPLFFFISGYLFFQRVDVQTMGLNLSSWSIYKSKISKRIKTLVIPYLAWNLIVLVLLLLAQYASHDSFQPYSKPLSDFTFYDILNSFWAISKDGYPIDGPLWFIRDLFIVCLMSPFVFFLFKYAKVWGIAILFFAYFILGRMLPIGASSTCQFFFCLGAACTLLSKDLLVWFSKIDTKLALCIFLLLLICLSFCDRGTTSFSIIVRIYRVAAVILIWPILVRYSNWAEKETIISLSNTSFFIFALHKPLMYVVSMLIFAVMKPQNEIILSLLIVIIPMITCIICLSAFYVIKQYIPSLKFLNGYRL
jgi:fucose 4-O-acetylase-like acetyltransferase